MSQRLAWAPCAIGHFREALRVRGDQEGVVLQAPGEGAGEPVDVKTVSYKKREPVQRHMGQDDGQAFGRLMLTDPGILSQEIPALIPTLQ